MAAACAAALVLPSKAAASYQRICAEHAAPILCEIRHHVRATHHLERYTASPITPHRHAAWRTRDPHYRVWLRRVWYYRHLDAAHLAGLPVVGIIRYVWPDASEAAAITVASCESGLRAWAANPSSTATGVFQILGGSTNPWWNTRQALRMYQARSWEPWYASISCWG